MATIWAILKKRKGHWKVNKTLSLTLVGITTILLSIVGYLVYQNQKLINRFAKPSPSPSTLASASPESSVNQEPSESPNRLAVSSPDLTVSLTQNAIKTNVNAKNFSGLIPYMTTPKVFVVLEATECCGDKTPQEATEQMNYIEAGIPFDFDQGSETVVNLKIKNPNLEKSYIGISTVNEQLIAFNIDNESHITNIEMSASWKLYNQ
ncbi:hypothetical protein HYU92_06765 [Candidatus Curtissbacteria bacterium]|nr:hypothetical protein [Candidatus Curtissbacteria bacterium]